MVEGSPPQALPTGGYDDHMNNFVCHYENMSDVFMANSPTDVLMALNIDKPTDMPMDIQM